MKIKYIGHSCFFLTASDGTTFLFDPYKSGAYGGSITYAPVTDEASIVVLSHQHEDHAAIKDLPNQPLVVTSGCQVRGFVFDSIDTFHDKAQGQDRGENRVFVVTIDDVRICHLGDLGHELDEAQREAIGRVDVLMVPVGGRFTIGPSEATSITEALQPKIVIPMHYKTEKCGFPIEPVDAFLTGKETVRRSTHPEVILKKEDLPEPVTYLFLPHSN